MFHSVSYSMSPLIPINRSVYNIEDYLPDSIREWVIVKLADFKELLIENGLLARQDNEPGESKAVQDARTRLNSITSELDTRKRDISDKETDLTQDYGPEEIFRALANQCIETESGEYIYELCFMGHTMQKPRNGGQNTNMGNFDRIEMVQVDEDEPADGKGLGSGERIALKYENGAHCWNGPARSTTVIFACAEKNEVWKVIEAEKCNYRMECGSPAACIPDIVIDAQKMGKDEL
jgi:protein kinase C substrate 80K-H